MEAAVQRTHSAELKAKVALEAIRERKTTAEIASAFDVHTTQIAFWKKHAIAQFPELFSSGKDRLVRSQDELVEKLYQKIGRLEVELDWLKKNAERLG